MANESSGSTTRLDIELPPAEDDEEGENISISYNHQLAIGLSNVSGAEESENAQEEAAAGGEVIPQPAPLSSDMRSAVTTLPERGEQLEVTSFRFEKVGNTSIVKRTRGRPRKDFQRTPKLHLSPSVASKVMRGRGRPRRDDLLHHKIFPGRPRFRGRKFPSYVMSHPSSVVHSIQNSQNAYDSIDSSIKTAICDTPEKMNTDGLGENELKVKKFCAFCNLSESSVLGQGKLTNFKPTSGFDCFESMKQKSHSLDKTVEVSSDSRSELKLLFRKQKSVDSSGHHRAYCRKIMKLIGKYKNK